MTVRRDDPLLHADAVRKVYSHQGSDLVAVDGVTLALHAHRCLGLVGESGSGKSTLARLLLGIELPTSGTVTVCGRDRSSPPRSRSERLRRAREVQIVFQDPYASLDPRQSPRTALDEVLRLHFPDLTRGERSERVDSLRELVGLSERQMAATPRHLSGGQRQRVAIARALAVEPAVLILDEAVSGLDVSVQAQILNVLADIRTRTGVSYLFITHDLSVVRQVADDIVIMHTGKVVEEGDAGSVLDRPRSAYAQALRAAVPGPNWTPARRSSADDRAEDRS